MNSIEQNNRFSLKKLLIVIVLYNEKLINAAPFKGIYKNSNEYDADWYVYDNSLNPDLDAKNYPNITYVHNPENPGVSTAYNRGAEYGQTIGKEWLLLFDQDTEVPDNFISDLQKQIKLFPDSEFYAMNLIKEGNRMSPSGYKYKRGYILEHIETGRNSLKNITFLNSGLLLSVSLFFKSGGYDANVPLYFSDFIFINRLRKQIDYFFLLPIYLNHSLSSNDMSDITAFKIRYDLYLKGTKESIISEKNGYFYYYLMALMRAVKLTVTIKDIYFLKSYWSVLFT